ncbi:MAG: 6-phosphogluconolactonase [Pseudomonadota bacterium]
MNDFKSYGSMDELSAAVAGAIAGGLREAVSLRGAASFVASGGGTPKPVYGRLSMDTSVPWDKITVTLSDERMAPSAAKVSNAEMLRLHLVRDAANEATFIPLDDTSALDDVSAPFDVVLLGMGADGHFASIFPEGEGMDAALAANAPRLVETTPSPLPPEAPYPRISLSLEAIRRSRSVFLMISGDSKREIYDRAASDDPAGDLPIRKLLHDPDLPLSTFWAP